MTYRCRDVLFSPKNWDFKMQISTETWVSPFSGKAPPALQRAASVSTSNYPPSAREEMPWNFGWGAELRLTCHQGKNGSQGTEKGFAMKLLDKTELCRENKIWNETVRRLTSLLLLQRGPGVLAESLTSHWDASSCKRLSSTYVSLGLNPFTTQSYLDILQPLAKYEARMGDLIGNNDGSTNSPCRLQTSSGNNSFTAIQNDKLYLFCSAKAEFVCVSHGF